jgi:hypothetical protein
MAVVEVFEAAVEVSRPLSKCPCRCRSVEAAVEVWKLLSKREAAVEMLRLLLRREAAVEVSRPPLRCSRLLSRREAAVEVAVEVSDRCRSVKAAVTVSMLPSRGRPLSKC